MTKTELYELMDIQEGTGNYENAEYMLNVEGFTLEQLHDAYKKLGAFWWAAEAPERK